MGQHKYATKDEKRADSVRAGLPHLLTPLYPHGVSFSLGRPPAPRCERSSRTLSVTPRPTPLPLPPPALARPLPPRAAPPRPRPFPVPAAPCSAGAGGGTGSAGGARVVYGARAASGAAKAGAPWGAGGSEAAALHLGSESMAVAAAGAF